MMNTFRRQPAKHFLCHGDQSYRVATTTLDNWEGHCHTLMVLKCREDMGWGVCLVVYSALKTGLQIADDVMTGQNIKQAATRCVTDAGKNVMRSRLATVGSQGVRAQPKRRKRPIKRATATRPTSVTKRRRKRHKPGDTLHGFRTSTILRRCEERAGHLQRATDCDEHRKRTMGGTPTKGITRFTWYHRISATRMGKRLHGFG